MDVRRFVKAAAAVMMSAGVLIGCAAEPPAEPEANSNTDPTSKLAPPSPEDPEPTAAAVTVVPSCEEILPLDQVHQNVQDSRMGVVPIEASRADKFAVEAFGPVAAEAYRDAVQLTDCRWAYPESDGVVDVVVGQLDPETRDQFMTALDDSVFVKGSHGAWTTYIDEDPQRRKSMQVRYGFSGDVWVATVGIIQPFFVPVLDRMAELNPHLHGG